MGTNEQESEFDFKEEEFEFDSDFLTFMSDQTLAENQIKRIIDNLDLSADIKSLLFEFAKVTIKVGDVVLKIGRKIIEYVCHMFKEFKNTSFGLIFGAIAGFLIYTIPILGMVLGPVFTPIAMSLGLVLGLNEDIKDRELKRKIMAINAKFTPLHSVKAKS